MRKIVNDAFLLVDRTNGNHIVAALGNLVDHLAIQVVHIDMIEPVALRSEKHVLAILQEHPSVGHFHISIILLGVKWGDGTGAGICQQQFHLVLQPIHTHHGQHIGILSPLDARHILVVLAPDIEFEGWDALQEYLNSLIDTEDNYTGNIYQRQFLNRDWQALYLPFSLSHSDWSAHFDVARINAFYQYDDDEDGIVDRQVLEAIIVRPGNGDLKANHPYLIRAKSKDTFQFNVNPSKVEGEQINSISCSTVEAKYTFTGNYSDMTGLKSAERYRIRGGSLSIPESDEEVLPPYRWYLTIDDLGNQLQPSAAKVGLRIVGDETPTSIGNMETDVMTESQKAFDISGRQIDVDASLSTLPKGIYIINNKKFIVK